MLKTVKEQVKKALGVGVYKIDREHNQRILNLYSTLVKKGDLVFDIGANSGNRIVPLLEIGANVIAVEPQEKCVEILRLRFGDKIKIEQKGLDSQNGTKSMHISDNTVLSTFSQEWIAKTKDERFKGAEWQHSQPVDMTTFDDLISKYGKPKFAKIDVEGYEKNVLSGLSHKIDYISLEYAVPEQAENLKECLDLLKTINPLASCNYAVSESMELALPSWISIDQMKTVISSKDFTATAFGDIYVSNIAS